MAILFDKTLLEPEIAKFFQREFIDFEALSLLLSEDMSHPFLKWKEKNAEIIKRLIEKFKGSL